MRLSVLRVGDGPRGVVLLHGFLGSGRNLWSLARAWSQRDPSRTFLLPDLTGHGTSRRLPPGAGLETMARDVLDTAREEGLTSPWTLVGHSLGGRVALLALDEAAEAIDRVVLLDISPAPIEWAGEENTQTAEAFTRVPAHFANRIEARAALTAEGLPRPLIDWLLTNLIAQGEGFGWRVDRQALLDLRPTFNAVDLWAVLERARGRVACIRGDLSPYVSDDAVRRMEALSCPVTTLAGAGHFLHVDQPQALLDALQAAVQGD